MKWIRIHAADPNRPPPPRYAQSANWYNGKVNFSGSCCLIEETTVFQIFFFFTQIYIIGGEYVTEKRFNTVLCVDPSM